MLKKMGTIRWNKQRLYCVMIGLIFIYLTCRFKYYEYVTEGTLQNTRADTLWEFFADFSNMKKLLPNLHSFHILSQSGNFGHWQYSVKYYEPLDDWPYTNTVGIADYSVRKDGSLYLVSSVHRTCLIGESICLTTLSEFEVRQSDNNAYYREIINYQCPPLLSYICFKQVDKQRRHVFKKLKALF